MYYRAEVTLLYQDVKLNVIKHVNLLGIVLIVLNNNDHSYRNVLSFQLLYSQLYFNLLDTLIAQCYWHLLLILKLYNYVFCYDKLLHNLNCVFPL